MIGQSDWENKSNLIKRRTILTRKDFTYRFNNNQQGP